MEEESSPRGGREGGSKPPPTAPAFFVILHPSQGDGSKEEGILVANRDVSCVAPVITTGPNESKSDFFLSANCTSGEITVTIDNNNMWNEFYRCNTEMVLAKQGRRMFPYCRYWITGLNPYLKYILLMDITPLDNHKYKWNGKWWEHAGKADPHVLGRVFLHPESPSTGQYWMHQPVSFYKLKLTNNILDQDGHIILHSMHRYLPRLHVVPAEKASEVIQLNGPDVHTFTFPQTEFIAVTAYQNFQITQLKIDCNPFAKGFREGTVTGRPVKDTKHKPAEPEVDSSSSKNEVENEDAGPLTKLQELFQMSEYLDGDKENESFNSVWDFLRFTKLASEHEKNSKQNEDVMKRLNEPSSVASLSKPTGQFSVKIKKEPEDNYDYSKATTIEGVAVKQEQFDREVTNDNSNSEVDYPILEKHFAKFKEDPYLDRDHSANSPTGAAQAKFIKLEQDSMYLEPCAAKNNLEAPEFQKPCLSENTLKNMDVQYSTFSRSPIFPSPSVISHIGNEVPVKEKRKRICKKKIDEIYATLQTALRTSRGPKRKFPLLFPKPSVTPTAGNEGTVSPLAKKRGRPPKPKTSKVGRPPKKDNPIEAPRLFPEFNPDLEDVDGVLFVAFSSKEALDVHTGNKPTDTVSSSFSTPEASQELTGEMQKILGLEKQLLTHLKMMKYRQVIHPALQQVGLKLNIVDPAMSIDLRYLGVELQLLYITSDTKYDDNGLCAQVSGLPFVSRTGKTTDYTKIKGWRDKFSTESAISPQKNEASRSESSMKNLSAFCSDELDEYLEKEAKLMDDLKELTQNEPESSISYQLPTKSSSYVRTLDSVLRKQAQQAMSSLNATESFPVPRKKRKYTRRVTTPRSNSKTKPLLPAPINTPPYSPEKKGYPLSNLVNKVMSTPTRSVECLSKSQPMVKLEQDLVTSVEDVAHQSCQQVQTPSQQIVSKPIGFSKAQTKLMELEEAAVWEGKPRTYITEERADLSLSTLLTLQVSLKNKPIQKSINKRTNSCNNEFCRLGCICSSLSFTKHTATHCRHDTCMFSCTCLKKFYIEGDEFKAKTSRTTQDEADGVSSSISGYGYQSVQVEHRVESLEIKHTEEHRDMSIESLHDRTMKAKKRKSNEGNDSKSDVRTPIRFPIWNRSDVADDPEPICIPKQAEFVELRISNKGHMEKSKSPGRGKAGRTSTVAHVHSEDPVYLHFDNTMTCARVRPYQCKAPEQKKRKVQRMRDSPTPVKQPDLKLSKARRRKKKDVGKTEVVEKKRKPVDNSRPTKQIKIISDCSREQDDNMVTSNEPQSFKLGNFDLELIKEHKSVKKSTSGTSCTRVKIAMSPGKPLNRAPPKPRSVKSKVERVKPPHQEPEDTSADKEAKSHGGKGLPFYTKVIPAGKLVTRLKTSDINEAELIEVNGKNYPHAKLLLGQLGALHPANRLAAYITRRLQPSLFHLSKVKNATAKMAAKSPSSALTNEENSKDILISRQNKTGIVAANDDHAMTLTSAPSNKDTVVTPPVLSPALVKSVAPTVNTSSTSPSHNPDINKNIATSIPNLLAAPNIRLGSEASEVGLNIASPMTVKSVSASPVSALSPPGVTSGLEKRFGPRLLLIPVNSGSSPSRPVQCVQSSPGQKMVLQPIKSANGVTLFRHPNGQIIQLVPLQQVPSANIQPNRQQVVIRNPGPVIGVRIPITTKPKAAATTSISIPTTTAPAASAPAISPVVSPSKSSSNQSGVIVFPQTPPRLSQLGTLAVKTTSPTSNCEAALSFPEAVSYTRSGHTVTPSNVIPLQSGDLSLENVALPALQNDSPLNAATKANLTLMGNKTGTVSDLIKQDKLSDSPSGSSGEKNGNEEVKECEEQPTLEIVDDEHEAGVQKSTKEQIQSVTKQVNTLAKDEQFQNAQQDNEQSQLSVDSINEFHASDVDLLQEDRKKNAQGLLTVGDQGPANKSDRQQSPADKSTNSEGKIGDSSPVNLASAYVQEQVAAGVEQNLLYETGEKTELSIEQVAADVEKNLIYKTGETAELPIEQVAADVEQNLLYKTGEKAERSIEQVAADVEQNLLYKTGEKPELSLEQVAAGVEQNLLYKTGEKAELSIEQRSSKPPVSASSSNQNNRESLKVDPHRKQAIFAREIRHSLQTEDESEEDEFVNFETVEALSKKINLNKDKCGTQGKFSKAGKEDSKSECDESVDIEIVEELSKNIDLDCLKASTTSITLNEDKCGQGKFSKGCKKLSKANEDDIFSTVGDEVPIVFHRRNHTVNERKRRSELRDLFEELKNSIGLHNLPKVSKSYILKQAIGEVEDLTDTADTLIKKKTFLSQAQTQLIKKVSNLSGKPKEVVLKKLEYLFEKQKATEAEKKNLEEDVALHTTPMNLPLSKTKPFFPLNLGEETNETFSSKTKKPIILARKPMLLSKEGKPQLGVSGSTSNVLMSPTGKVGKEEHGLSAQVARIPPKIIQAELSPVQMKSGMTSVVIQLPSTIKFKDTIDSSPLPISLSTMSDDISITSSGPESENDDLSMMPKIVSVTSLAQGANSDFGRELEITISNVHSLCTESYVSGNASVQDSSYVTAESCVPSTSIPLDKMEETTAAPEIKSCSQYSSLLENLTQENNSSNTEASLKSENVSMSNASPSKMVVDITESRLDLELKKLTSAIDEAGLEPSELSDTMADPEDADETLTSLLDEIAFLNQQLNPDPDGLDSISDFPGSDSASRSSVNKFSDGDSFFSFGRLKEVPEAKEKNISFSPHFMQLEEGEVPDNSKHNEEAGIVVFEGGAVGKPPLTALVGAQSRLRQPPATVSSHQRTEKPVTSCSDVFWRPMPKLAPLGLKSPTMPSDEKLLASKSMPSLASVAKRLSSHKTTD